ncbi:MAG: SUMF1/EgtB/PvdO family nonheme iron enzyme [Phycisphaerales bacterium]
MPRSTSIASTQRIAALLLLAAGAAASAQPTTTAPKADAPAQPLAPFAQEIPVAAFKIDMLPVPASLDGKIKPFYMSKTELTWEAFDVFIYRLDEEANKAPKGADAVTRPSKPYLPPDRGFGHEHFAAISMSHKNATEFCKWLSAATGRTYRLATEAEWEWAARANPDGKPSDKPTGTAVPEGSQLADCAWLESNSKDSPQKVGSKKPNALGLVDMLGNVAEWVDGTDGKPATKGGSFRDSADKLTVTGRAPLDKAWNSSDPQVPKSKWWLADAPFVGFRIVCEATPPAAAKPADTKPTTTTPTTPAEPEKKP